MAVSVKLSAVTITHWNNNQESGREQEGGRWKLGYNAGDSREKHFKSLHREQEQQTLPKLQCSCVSRGPGVRATTVSQVSGERHSPNKEQSHELPADGKS